MAAKSLPPPSLLRQLLRYESDTGKLFWNERCQSLFEGGKRPSSTDAAVWNARYAGKEAFTALSRGYRHGSVLGKNYFAHRVAWAIHHGAEPLHDIDHINGRTEDNRIENLRDVSHQTNMRNMRKHHTNTSGAVGVYYRPDTGKWSAYIGSGSDRVTLGSYPDKERAMQVRKMAENERGFHAHHGRAYRGL